MIRFTLTWSIFLLIASVGFAQSGRTIQPVPSPSPVSEMQTSVDYSESKPARDRALLPASNASRTGIPPKSNDNSAENDADILRIDTNLIIIPAAVFDRNGLYIPNLTQNEFKVFEDDQEQQIAFFGTTEQFFTVVILLDTSPSTLFKIEEIQKAAIAFIDQLKPQDKVMVVEFDENIHVLAGPTSNRKKLYKAVRRADMGGGTSIYDAVDFALRKRLAKIKGRKAIVLFTDGVDTTSDDASYKSTLRYAEEADTTIFPIYYNTFDEDVHATGRVRGTSPEEYRVGRKYIDELAEATGGRVFHAESTAISLNSAFAGIAEELRRQYNIGYYPNEIGEPGQRKLLRVRINRPNLIVRARGSYIVGGNR